MRVRATKTSIVLRALFLAALLAVGARAASAQFTEDFGKVGTVHKFQGQIRDSLDAPVFGAVITIKNVSTNDTHELIADENGVFRTSKLPRGEYAVRVRATGFNFADYVVNIDPAGSKMYVVTRLSPGCASGDSGVALVKRLKDRTIDNDK